MGIRSFNCGWIRKAATAVVITALFTISQAQAQSSTSTLRFTQKTHDFGEIKEDDGKVSHIFQFTNTGSTSCVIQQVEVSCGCTSPVFSREPIAAGGRGSITVTFDPAGRPGGFSKSIVVISNNQQNRDELQITGSVIGRARSAAEDFPVHLGRGVRVERTSVGFGYLPRGMSKSVMIGYCNDSEELVQLGLHYEVPNPYFAVVLAPSTLQPGQRGVMTITYDLRAANLWGRITNNFQISVNGERITNPLTATGIATEDFSSLSQQELMEAPEAHFSSQYYHFGTSKIGTKLHHEFTITNNGAAPLIIRHIKTDPHITTDLWVGRTVAPGEVIAFSATFDTQGVPEGQIMQSLLIIMNDPKRPMREIRLAAVLQ